MGAISVFVTRANTQEASDQDLSRDRLSESRNSVVQNCETFYDRVCQVPRFYTAIQNSDRPLRSSGSFFQ
ncbi:uncharacterized protein N7500_005211 [Penicillium coprophilum]|uniref:uncharacterized protein n=1 Tax=Penicillium coprophilum TaxID=36646 RepID=UPI0023899DF9|nr:uncharacterized protein N7500_005211 [Penicillium coprophilum]KAJ5163381.1 hypothetical protein N7500_005211 [Penicillium coprophilum]